MRKEKKKNYYLIDGIMNRNGDGNRCEYRLNCVAMNIINVKTEKVKEK